MYKKEDYEKSSDEYKMWNKLEIGFKMWTRYTKNTKSSMATRIDYLQLSKQWDLLSEEFQTILLDSVSWVDVYMKKLYEIRELAFEGDISDDELMIIEKLSKKADEFEQKYEMILKRELDQIDEYSACYIHVNDLYKSGLKFFKRYQYYLEVFVDIVKKLEVHSSSNNKVEINFRMKAN